MVQSFLQNAKRFVLRFQTILADAPLQIYYSTIVFAQQTSVIRQTFEQQVLHEVKMLSMKETDWDGCRSTLEGHSDYVGAMSFSPDRKILPTNVGDIPLSYSGLVPSLSWQINQYANILIQGQWILRDQQCLLWLPSEYRSTSTAVYLDVVCLGLLYGCVVLLKVL
jgi:hypothetical protein